MHLGDIGYNESIEQLRHDQGLLDYEIGRVVAEHRERYIVRTANGDIEAEITGNMRFTAKGREDFPAVGDWVALIAYDSEFSIIHQILPRSSTISRQAVGQVGEAQLIATNIDYALLVQAVDRDFNINRLERYLTICYASQVEPVIVLTKTDLINDMVRIELIESIVQRHKGIPVLTISNITHDGFEALTKIIKPGKTYCMLGSSGVGKSTLLNNLLQNSAMKTATISSSTSKGKHTTSHRELFVLDSGGILIDTPGMREVGIIDEAGGLETTFDTIFNLAKNCRYKDCTHTGETGCAVLQALEDGDLDQTSYENYLKMEREKSHFDSTLAERRKKDKQFGKMYKNMKKDIGKRKF